MGSETKEKDRNFIDELDEKMASGDGTRLTRSEADDREKKMNDAIKNLANAINNERKKKEKSVVSKKTKIIIIIIMLTVLLIHGHSNRKLQLTIIRQLR